MPKDKYAGLPGGIVGALRNNVSSKPLCSAAANYIDQLLVENRELQTKLAYAELNAHTPECFDAEATISRFEMHKRLGAEKEREIWVAWLTEQLTSFPDPDEPVTSPMRDLGHEMLLAAANTIREIRDAMASGAPPSEKGGE